MISTREALDALPDALAQRWGNKPGLPHPRAHDIAINPLSRVATAIGEGVYAARGAQAPNQMAALGAGIKQPDYQNALAASARQLAAASYAIAATEHRLLCADQEVADFKAAEFPNSDVDVDLSASGESAERINTRVVPVQGQSATLTSYGRDFLISRRVVVNDDVGLIGRTFAAIGSAAARIEGRLVAELLDSNPTLADGSPLFAADNTVAETLAAATLEMAMKALRVQPTPAGNVANNKAHALAVAAGMELSALTMLKAAGLDLPVVCLPWLTAGRWYLLASPLVAPVIGRLTLAGQKDLPIIVGPRRTRMEVDGFLLSAIADVGVVALGRVGVVRGGA